MTKRNKKVLPDEEVKETISQDKKSSPRGASSKVLGTIIKPLSETKDKEDIDTLSDSSLRSPLEAVLFHEYAKYKMDALEDTSEKGLVCMIKDLLCGIKRENDGFLRDRQSYDKDLGILSSILSDVLPKDKPLKNLIARALYGEHDYNSSNEAQSPRREMDHPSTEVLKLLK